MMPLNFEKKVGAPYQILCLGAHSDDIEIGCGGTLLKLIDLYPDLHIHWVVIGANSEREREASNSAFSLLEGVSDKKIEIGSFRDSFFPYMGAEIKEYFQQLKMEVSPDLILTHYRDDRHQDHRLISDLTWNTFRDCLIWEYEIPKYDGDLGIPNLFVHLSAEICHKKVAHLFTHFESQANKGWFTEDIFFSMLRIRGMESNSPSKYAEAFHCRKLVF
jgi:LmbE family N-acetylglucosaminyl deacetylase